MVVSEPPDSDGGSMAIRWVGRSSDCEPSTRLRFNDSYGYQVLAKVHETPDRFPRRVGIPAKRPLF